MATQPEILQSKAAPVEAAPRKHTYVTPELIEQVRILATQFQYREVARRIGLHRTTVLKIYKRLGIAMQGKQNFYESKLDDVRLFHVRGLTALEISRETRIPLDKIYKLLGGMQLTPNRKPSRPADPETGKVVVIRVTAGMRKCASEAGIEVGRYFVDLYLADAAERNSIRPRQNANAKPNWKPEPEIEVEKKSRKTDPAKVQAVLHLLEEREEGVGVAQIAERCGVSRTTVRRIMENYRASTIRTKIPHEPSNHKKWDDLVQDSAQKTRGEAAP